MAYEKTIMADTASFKARGAIAQYDSVTMYATDTTGATVKTVSSQTDLVIGYANTDVADGGQVSVILTAPIVKKRVGSGGVTILDKLISGGTDYNEVVTATIGNTTGTTAQFLGIALESGVENQYISMLMMPFYFYKV